MSPETAPSTYWIALGAAAAIVIGSLGTWATALGGIVTKNGTDGDGVITLVLALLALASLWGYWQDPRRGPAVAVLVLGILILEVGVYDLVDVENTSSFAGADLVHAGWGLYLVVIGSVILGLASFDWARRASGLHRST